MDKRNKQIHIFRRRSCFHKFFFKVMKITSFTNFFSCMWPIFHRTWSIYLLYLRCAQNLNPTLAPVIKFWLNLSQSLAGIPRMSKSLTRSWRRMEQKCQIILFGRCWRLFMPFFLQNPSSKRILRTIVLQTSQKVSLKLLQYRLSLNQ